MRLIEITKENWEAVIALSTSEDQFIASNLYSIAESQFYSKAVSRAIEVDGEIVGYVMYGEDEVNQSSFFIDRFMIASRYRGKGYGKKGLEEIIQIWKNSKYKILETSVVPDNTAMIGLLKNVALKLIGNYVKNEEVFFISK